MLKIDFHPPQKQLQQFAWFSLIGFPLIGWLLLYYKFEFSTTVAWVLTAIGVGIFVLGMVSTNLIKPVFIGLMALAIPIGFVLSTLVLCGLYYLLFTPVALFFKLIGRDKLQRRWDPSATSYWVERKEVPLARYLRMY